MSEKMKRPAPPKKGVFGRVLKTLIRAYPAMVPLTAVCILFSSLVAAVPDILIKRVVAVIETWQPTRNWEAAAKEILPQILVMAILYVISLGAVFLYTQLMAVITQGYLYKMRRSRSSSAFWASWSITASG